MGEGSLSGGDGFLPMRGSWCGLFVTRHYPAAVRRSSIPQSGRKGASLGVLERIGLNQCISFCFGRRRLGGTICPMGQGRGPCSRRPLPVYFPASFLRLPTWRQMPTSISIFSRLRPDLPRKTAQGHQEVVGIVAFEIVDGEERFFEPGVEQGPFPRAHAARPLVNRCRATVAGPRG